MPTVNIEDKLYDEIRDYCKLNRLTISVFVNDLLKKNFMVEKYDDAPPFFKKRGPEIEPIQVDIIKKMVEENAPQEFEQECLAKPEPVKKKEYVKPEVISVDEKKDGEVSPKERARKRIQYL